MKTTKRFFSIVFFLLLIASPFQNQAQSPVYGGSGGFYIGGKTYDAQNYNAFMPEEADGIDDHLITIGGGGYGIYNNVIVGGYGFYRGGGSTDYQNLEYNLNGGGGYLNLGYAIFHNQKSLLFPMIGVGFEGMSLEKLSDGDEAFNQDQFLSTSYGWNSAMGEIAIGYDFFPFEDGYGLKLGLRAGYQVSLSRDSDWHHEGGDITGAGLPENNLDGFFINLVIGGGGFGTGKNETH